MPYDRNGWYASDSLPTRALVIDGEPVQGGVLDHDDAFTVLQYVAQELHNRVERIYSIGWHPADDWGYYYRANVNDPDSLSRHALALAFDYNATRHPNGTPALAGFTYAQIITIRQIVNVECMGAVQWGGDFRSTSDPMHFQIDSSKALVALAAANIRDMRDDDMKEEDFDRILKIVQNNTPDATKIREIVREEIDAQFDEQTTVRTETGTRTITWRTLWKETWQKLNKHT